MSLRTVDFSTREEPMVIDTEGFRRAHGALCAQQDEVRALARRLPELSRPERNLEIGAVLAYLRKHVEPHTKLDERLLYPAVAERLGDPLVAATMNYDHLAIRDWIAKLADADLQDTDLLQELLYGLTALISVHVWKENELFLRSLESPDWPAQA
jgi:hemerythrin-like domain-containing protein